MSKKDFKNPAEYFITPDQPEPVNEDLPEFQVPAGYRLVKEVRSKRLQLLLPPQLVANLKARAAIEEISLNQLCNRIFEEYLKKGEDQ